MQLSETIHNHCRILRVYPHKPQKRKPIPLQSVHIDWVVENRFATAQISQKFINLDKKPIECEYFFPVSDSAVVTGLQVQLDDGRVLTAKVEEETRAKEFYEDQMSEGNSVILGQESTPDRMRLAIGNMAEGCGATVLVTLSFPVQTNEGAWKFFLPASLTPLCEAMGEAARPGSIRPQNCTYNLHFVLKIISRDTISYITSTSHPLIVENHGLTADISIDPANPCYADRDFVIKYKTQFACEPGYQLNYDPETNTYAAAVSFLPSFLEPGEDEDDLEGSGEFIFVLDRSGSMRGARMALAKEAAILFLKSLPENSKFNIISFGSRYEAMFQTPVVYNDKSMSRAIEKIQGFGANMGGTNIYNPLLGIFGQRTEAPRQIFVLTDGVVANPQETIDLISQNAGNSRVHAFGIGEGVSTYLVNNCARAGKGQAEFIAQGENLQSKVIGVLGKALVPALTNWSVHWTSPDVTQAPGASFLPAVYYNEILTVYAHLGANPLSGPVSLEYINSRYNRKESTSIDIDVTTATQSDQVHKLWAKERIRELEFMNRMKADCSNDIISLSKLYGIPSSITAYICVEKKDDPVTGECSLRKVPIVITSDRNPTPAKIQEQARPGKRASGIVAPRIKGAIRSLGIEEEESKSLSISRPAMDEILVDEVEEVPEKRKPLKKKMKKKGKKAAAVADADEEDLPAPSLDMDVIKLQNANGSWEPFVFGYIKINQEPMLADMTQWATAVVIVWLQQNFPHNAETWCLVVRKAIRWLKSQGVDYTVLPINFHA